jgi:hypothetical protein
LARRTSFWALLFPIFAISLVASYLVLTTGSFALDHYQDIIIEPRGYAPIQIWCVEDDALQGSFEVDGRVEIDFYVMSEEVYSHWSSGDGYPGDVYIQEDVETHSWSTTIDSDGYYFVVYNNEDSTVSAHILGSFHITSGRDIVGPLTTVTILIFMGLAVLTKLVQKMIN